MGCVSTLCEKQSYSYNSQISLLLSIFPQFSNLGKCYTNDFVIKCHKNLTHHPQSFLFKYQKKLSNKQSVSHYILQKWKLILYGTNIENEHYVDSLGFDKELEQERIIPSSKIYRFSKHNPFEIRIQDLYFHQSYKQIEKDANRVFLVPQLKQQLFQKVLKKIANHFPQSGYSLGINYVVAYFLLIGMSEMDSFWMFVHLALNEKYLALGLFQNSLPLAHILMTIFKNILRRKNSSLHHFIYEQLQLKNESWILKWIISFYLSILPIQFCHYIWDFILTKGIVGLAIVAYVIVNTFQEIIYTCDDEVDFDINMKEAFKFTSFNDKKGINIESFMHEIYVFQLKYMDFDLDRMEKVFQELKQIKSKQMKRDNKQQEGENFYVKYFRLYAEWKFRNNMQSYEQMKITLSLWYESISKKRQSFEHYAKTSGTNFFTALKSNELQRQRQIDKLLNQIKKQAQDQEQQKNQMVESQIVQQEIIDSQNKFKDDQDEKLTHISLKNIQISPPLDSGNRSLKRHKIKSRQSKKLIENEYYSQNNDFKNEENKSQKAGYSQKILQLFNQNNFQQNNTQRKQIQKQIHSLTSLKCGQLKQNSRKVKSQSNFLQIVQKKSPAYSLSENHRYDYLSLNSLKNEQKNIEQQQIVFNSRRIMNKQFSLESQHKYKQSQPSAGDREQQHLMRNSISFINHHGFGMSSQENQNGKFLQISSGSGTFRKTFQKTNQDRILDDSNILNEQNNQIKAQSQKQLTNQEKQQNMFNKQKQQLPINMHDPLNQKIQIKNQKDQKE